MERNQGVTVKDQSNDSINKTKIIYYRKGDESFPKTEDLSKKDWNEYLFSDIYEKAVGLISDIVKVNVLNKEKTFTDNINIEAERVKCYSKEVFNNTRNNIVAFIGERGAGKTSCLQTMYNGLCNIACLKELYCIFDRKLPIIDPSYFNEHSNILEIVIAQMFLVFKNELQCSNNYLSPDNNFLEKKENWLNVFKMLKKH